MNSHHNEYGQPIGFPLGRWQPPPLPPRAPLTGRWCCLEPLDPGRHAEPLFSAFSADNTGKLWTYLGYGPFDTVEEYKQWMAVTCLSPDPLFFAIRERSKSEPAGVASYLRITPASGSIEVGHLLYAPSLQHTVAATEAMYLLMKQAFALGYRRYEWKCDVLNASSRAAAQRLGFSFEGVFRQATVYKGRNRDTAWYAMIDREWPGLETAFLTWLDPSNFDSAGNQHVRLSELTRATLKPSS